MAGATTVEYGGCDGIVEMHGRVEGRGIGRCIVCKQGLFTIVIIYLLCCFIYRPDLSVGIDAWLPNAFVATHFVVLCGFCFMSCIGVFACCTVVDFVEFVT